MYIIKESLNNIRKHAQARQVFIEITATVAAISVQIKDDGLGFDVMTYQNNPVGLGLNIMQERAKGINGELIIESLTGQGTTINLHVPC
jgi:two-component system nitrate/nitrite sensor histidine kinase NarX